MQALLITAPSRPLAVQGPMAGPHEGGKHGWDIAATSQGLVQSMWLQAVKARLLPLPLHTPVCLSVIPC